MNKRGNIAFLSLPLVALAFSLFLLYVFVSFNGSFYRNSEKLSEMMYGADFAQDYVLAKTELIFYKTVNCDKSVYESICDETDLKKRFILISNKENMNYYEQGNLFAKIRNKEFEISEIQRGYKIEIKELFVQIENVNEGELNKNKVKRNFDLEIEFDDKGEVVNKKAGIAQGF